MCRQLGFAAGMLVPIKESSVKSNDPGGWLVFTDGLLYCTENSTVLLRDCQAAGVQYNANCSSYGYSQQVLLCYGGSTPGPSGALRLIGPQSAVGTGEVQVQYNGVWGDVAYYSPTTPSGLVSGDGVELASRLCLALGYPAVLESRTSAALTPSAQLLSTPVMMVAPRFCSNSMGGILTCYNNGVPKIGHYYRLNVTCGGTLSKEWDVSLSIPYPGWTNSGYTALFYQGVKGWLCGGSPGNYNGAGPLLSSALCRQLGHGSGIAVVRMGAVAGWPPAAAARLAATWSLSVQCTGAERKLRDCPSNFPPSMMGACEPLALQCFAGGVPGSDGKARLVGAGSAAGRGELQVLLGGVWYWVVRDPLPDLLDATVALTACQLSGFSGQGGVRPSPGAVVPRMFSPSGVNGTLTPTANFGPVLPQIFVAENCYGNRGGNTFLDCLSLNRDYDPSEESVRVFLDCGSELTG